MDMKLLSPMMRQYVDLKNKHKDCLLFFRLGDFYELFFEDAKLVSKELELTLTGKSCGLEERAPMCGIPYQAVDSYIVKLIELGYKVAIAEQMENAQDSKNLVKREVTRIVTRGNILDMNILDEKKNNYIVCVYKKNNECAIASVDITTGEFLVTCLENTDERKIIDEVAKFNPAEIIINNKCGMEKIFFDVFEIKAEKYFDWAFDFDNANKKLCEHFKVFNLSGFGFENNKFDKNCIIVAGALLDYLYGIQKSFQAQISLIKKYFDSEFMIIDIASRKNLELTQTNRDKNKRGSLVWVLDKTRTAMGARLLRKWIEQPLINVLEINKRLDAVEEFLKDIVSREEIKELLSTVYDIERLLSKIVNNIANAKHLVCLGKSFEHLVDIKNLIRDFKCDYVKEIYNKFDDLQDMFKLIDTGFFDEVPMSLHEGNFIKTGFNNELDELREIKEHAAQIIYNLEEKERDKTGIKNLKIRNNRVFGYYIEVTNSNKNLVPDYYIRKQTLTNCERFFTDELKKIEDKIINAQEKINELEYKIFLDIVKKVIENIFRIQETANFISVIDVLISFADVADRNNYVKPEMNLKGKIDIKAGRHPVVEKFLNGNFIDNDVYLDLDQDKMIIITGPNMAGKSTYMRQTALIVLMAQIGCFVPAEKANISVVDRIFTRVGASDDLATGQSTFMVEMNEVANILNCATKNSLVIIDEVGRGTGTYDGLSIAWSVIEYISQELGCKTLFATHYHELTELEGKIFGVKNYCAAVKEDGDNVIFLRNIIPGGMNHSYGIYVAKLAGLPDKILKRAQEIFLMLDENDTNKNNKDKNKEVFYGAKKPFDEEANRIIIRELKKIDIKKMSVREILRAISSLQNRC